MKKQFFRLCSMILVLVMVLNTLPLQSFATDLRENLSAAQLADTATASNAVVVEEIPSKRTEYTKEFLLSNGLRMAAVYPDAVHYEKDGQWAEIDNTLKTNLNGTITNTAGIWDVSFPQNLTGSKYVTITKDGYTLSFAMAGELRQNGNLEVASVQGGMTTASLTEPETVSLSIGGVSETYAVSAVKSSAAQIQTVDLSATKESLQHQEIVPEKSASRLMYSNVYDNTNIRYDLQSNQVKESIILNQYNSALRGYRFNLNVGELIPVLGEDGHIDFYDAEKEDIVMVMPAPFLVDNAMEYSYDVQVSLTGSGSNYTLTYLLPRQWLADSSRSWPVVLDPAVKPNMSLSNLRDHTIAEGKNYSHEWGVLDAGYTEGIGIYRFFLMYINLPQLTSSDVIVSADIQLSYLSGFTSSFPLQVHKVCDTWNVETLTWANKPDFEPNIVDYEVITTNKWYQWNVTDIVRGWYSGANTGMMFKSTDEVELSEVNWYRQFYSSNYQVESRPILTIYFRNNNGLEGYWDYTASSAGRAGTGYVNNFTGNLTWIRNDIGFGGNRAPVSISHIYNANDSIIPADRNNNSDDSGGNYFGLGYGWRTNYHQRVFLWEHADQDEDTEYYIWEDADGTDHYFEKESSGVYKDEDGLELTLKTTGSGTKKYSITDKDGNVSYFDTEGRLTSIENNQQTKSSISIEYVTSTSPRISAITDGAGRKYTFTYNSSDMLTRISYKGTGTTEISYVAYGYTDSNLTTITDKDGGTSEYTYNANHLLTAAEDIDGYTLSYTYNTVSDTYQPYRVINIEETHNSSDGGTLAIEYAHNQTTFTDHNGNVQIMQFNDFGNLTSIQDAEGHAQFAQYALNTDKQVQNNSDATAKGNQLRASSKLQNTVGNMLKDSSFESSNTWTLVNSSVTQAINSSYAYRGNKSLKLTRSAAGTASGVYTTFKAAPGKTYTFSAYVKTDAGSAYLDLNDGSATVTSETLGSNKDWTRLEVSYTNNAASDKTVSARLMTTAATTAYIDCAQVEQAVTASRYNLIENGDFRYTGSPAYGWTGTGLTSIRDIWIETDSTAAGQLDNSAFQLKGDPLAKKRLSQTVKVSGSKNDTFVLAGWAKADSAPLRTREFYQTSTFGIQAVFNYTDGTTSDTFTASFNPDTNSQCSWQYTAQVMVADKAYSSITVRVLYDYNVNLALFDGIQLYKEAYGSSYTYDENGNVLSVKDLRGQTTNYEYNTDGELTKILQDNKAKMTYTYDDWHNVLTATSEEGVAYSFAYDTYGNNTSVSIGSGSTKITSSAAYTTDGNRLVSTTDAAGKVTTYSYNANTNVLEWVQYPNGANTKTTYTYDSMYRVASASAAAGTQTLSAAYTYSNDLLTKITTGSTTYNFSYGDFALRSSIKIGSRTLASYTYTDDQNNYLKKLAYGNNDSVQYTYDDLGRVTKETFEDGATVEYKYDNDGALATVTDSATGIKTTYYYDFTDRLMKYVESGTGYSHSVGYEYDQLNNLTALVETINGVEHTTSYTYDDDNRLTAAANGNVNQTYSYDSYGRLNTHTVKNGSSSVVTNSYIYRSNTAASPTAQIEIMRTVTPAYEVQNYYEYDDNGNITFVSDGFSQSRYVYDSANQLIREDNQGIGKSWTWSYDDAGNILTRTEYAYTTGTLGTPLDTVTYAYGDSSWGDLLTSYDGQTITSDQIGNMLSDGTWNYTWKHGRQLASMSNGTTTWSYTYNADGLRTKRTNGTTTYSYTYAGSQLSYMTAGSHTLRFVYGSAGPAAVIYDGTPYYYITNLQGDVTAIVDSTGAVVVTYSYNGWGKAYGPNGPMASTLGTYNPLRYRGYVYDTETGLYYLQSRYYDPELGRFINADGFVSTGQGIIGNNMFAYCGNNPVLYIDYSGTRHEISAGVLGGFSTSSDKDENWNYGLRKMVQVIEAVISNADIGIAVGLGMSGSIDTLDLVDLEAGIRYDLISIGFQDGQFYCQQEYFTGIDGTVLVVFDWDFHSENKVRNSPFSKDFGPWEEDKSNDIWTIVGGGLYLVGGARYHIGLDILSLLEDLDSIF